MGELIALPHLLLLCRAVRVGGVDQIPIRLLESDEFNDGIVGTLETRLVDVGWAASGVEAFGVLINRA